MIILNVTAIDANEVIHMTPEAEKIIRQHSIPESVRAALKSYFDQLDGQAPNNLYDLVLAEVEKPLIEMVLQLTSGNQSKTAKMMGISRGTLRKKMAIYEL